MIGSHDGAVRQAMFAAWLRHAPPGNGVSYASYAYIVVPDVTLSAFAGGGAAAVAATHRIVANNQFAQAVQLDAGTGRALGAPLSLQAVFYSKGGGSVDGGPGWRVRVTSAGVFQVVARPATSSQPDDGQGAPAAAHTPASGSPARVELSAAFPPQAPWDAQLQIDRVLSAGRSRAVNLEQDQAAALGNEGAGTPMEATPHCTPNGVSWPAGPEDGSTSAVSCLDEGVRT
jgi:hypothetical protein